MISDLVHFQPIMSLLKSILKLSAIKRIKFIDKCQSKAAFYGTTYNILPCFLEFGFAMGD